MSKEQFNINGITYTFDPDKLIRGKGGVSFVKATGPNGVVGIKLYDNEYFNTAQDKKAINDERAILDRLEELKGQGEINRQDNTYYATVMTFKPGIELHELTTLKLPAEIMEDPLESYVPPLLANMIASGATQALADVHQHGVVHNDVKPRNFKVDLPQCMDHFPHFIKPELFDDLFAAKAIDINPNILGEIEKILKENGLKGVYTQGELDDETYPGYSELDKNATNNEVLNLLYIKIEKIILQAVKDPEIKAQLTEKINEIIYRELVLREADEFILQNFMEIGTQTRVNMIDYDFSFAATPDSPGVLRRSHPRPNPHGELEFDELNEKTLYLQTVRDTYIAPEADDYFGADKARITQAVDTWALMQMLNRDLNAVGAPITRFRADLGQKDLELYSVGLNEEGEPVIEDLHQSGNTSIDPKELIKGTAISLKKMPKLDELTRSLRGPIEMQIILQKDALMSEKNKEKRDQGLQNLRKIAEKYLGSDAKLTQRLKVEIKVVAPKLERRSSLSQETTKQTGSSRQVFSPKNSSITNQTGGRASKNLRHSLNKKKPT